LSSDHHASEWVNGYLATQQQAILRYISEQQLHKPVVIGYSLAGYLAFALASGAAQSNSFSADDGG
jgi:pimeloyl-ACP methyl ester carboxylesterase